MKIGTLKITACIMAAAVLLFAGLGHFEVRDNVSLTRIPVEKTEEIRIENIGEETTETGKEISYQVSYKMENCGNEQYPSGADLFSLDVLGSVQDYMPVERDYGESSALGYYDMEIVPPGRTAWVTETIICQEEAKQILIRWEEPGENGETGSREVILDLPQQSGEVISEIVAQ